MTFTPLHRSLGLPPSTLTDEILDAAVAARVAETDDLDWKSELPSVKGLPRGEHPGEPRRHRIYVDRHSNSRRCAATAGFGGATL